MRTLTTPQGSFLTGSALAEAVLKYDQALSDVGTTAAVDLPVLVGDAKLARALVTVGWRQCLESATSDADVDELTDDHAVRGLDALTAAVAPRRGTAFSEGELAEIDWTAADF